MNKIIEKLAHFYRKQLFQPTVPAGLFLNDFFIPRGGLFRFIQSQADSVRGNVLDIGCGSKPYQNLFSCEKYTGVDIENEGHSHENENIDFYYDGKKLPFENYSFDNAVCFEVLEHVFDPDLFLTEINRVLKPGGKLLMTTPFIWNEHEIPNDYGRYSSYGLTYLMKKNGFEVVSLKKILNGPELFIVLLQVYFNDFRYWLTRKLLFIPKVRWIIFILFMPLIFILNFIGWLLTYFFRDDRFYFNNGVLVRKK